MILLFHHLPVFFPIAIGHFRCIKIQHDGKSSRTQTKEVNKHGLFLFSLFVSFKTHYHAES